jgi:hypothetical protein
MSAQKQADAQLSKARRKAIKEKMMLLLPEMRFAPARIERADTDEDWTNTLALMGRESEHVRGAQIVVRTPSPLDFERVYDWGEIEFCRMWIHVYQGAEYLVFTRKGATDLKLK